MIRRAPSMIFCCGSEACQTCKSYLRCSSFVPSKGETWEVNFYDSCNSLWYMWYNVVYFLKCDNATYTEKKENFRNRTNDHISKCRTGKSTNKFDIHVHQCSLNHTPREPFFKAHIFMVLNDYNKLLNMERKLHLNYYILLRADDTKGLHAIF